MRSMAYAVSTPVYEGPFDLLLHLILQEEVDLFEINLAQLIDAFLAQVDQHGAPGGGLDLEVCTEFLLIAATLVELKARRLLPNPESIDLDEELLRFEARDLLLARLLECKTFKDVAFEIDRRIRAARRSVARSAGPEEPFRSMVPDPLAAVSLDALRNAAVRALTPKPVAIVRLDHVAPIRISVAEAAETVLARLPAVGTSMTFRALIEGIDGKIERIVHFLAVLELYKQGIVELDQTSTFGTLTVRRIDAESDDGLDRAGLDDWDDAMDAGNEVDDSDAADAPTAIVAFDSLDADDIDARADDGDDAPDGGEAPVGETEASMSSWLQGVER
jgi:segregation and condensation protein A